VDSVVFVTMLPTNVVQCHAGLANHASTIVKSVQEWSFEFSLGILGRMASAISDKRIAPHNSSLGRDTVLTGATRVLAIDRSPLCLLRGVTESVMLYAELWTEGNPSGYSDLV